MFVLFSFDCLGSFLFSFGCIGFGCFDFWIFFCYILLGTVMEASTEDIF